MAKTKAREVETAQARISDPDELRRFRVLVARYGSSTEAVRQALRCLYDADEGTARTVTEWALAVLPDEQDREDERRINELRRHKGLSPRRREEIDEQAMRGVRAFAAEQQARVGGILAGSGNHSAASIQAALRANQGAVHDAQIKAADIGIREHAAQVERDEAELRERLERKVRRDRERATATGRPLSPAVRRGLEQLLRDPSCPLPPGVTDRAALETAARAALESSESR